MAHVIDDFAEAMKPIIHDDASKLAADELRRFAQQAIVGRYSQDSSLELVSDIAGNGTYFLDLPEAPEDQYGVFDPEFSVIKSLEYPIERTPRELLLDADYAVYRKPSGYTIQVESIAPTNNEIVRCTWTSRHKDDGSTVPDKDYFAVVDFAASLALEALASMYIQTGDAAIAADTVNYRTKSQEYLAMAKAVRRRYFNHLGVEEGATGGGGSDDKAAMASGDMSLVMNSGVDRLIHGRYTR